MKKCELCKSMAMIYCDSDRASLCWTCDAKVHSANFLVARHSRTLLCQLCQSPTSWTASGRKLWPSKASGCRRCTSNQEGVGGTSYTTQDFSPKRKHHNSHEEEMDSSWVSNNRNQRPRMMGDETGSSFHSTVSSSNTGSVDNIKKHVHRNMHQPLLPRRTLELDLNLSAID